MLAEERRNTHAIELKMSDAARREESLKTDVERYKMRVESKWKKKQLKYFFLGLQKHIDNMQQYGSQASLRANNSVH